ncbi:MAG TPA: L,D-transpeptidase family protein [Aliidongia sp.]|nr:L,D-transpeptidase family protein [Aliidongia sp.]
MDLLVSGDGTARFADSIFRCALGRGGLSDAKREGDGATPIGAWPLRRLLYRPDRLKPPATGLPITPIGPADGWCDAPGDRNYNLPVILPYPASAETLWREDAVYDLIVPLGYNDGPILPGRGSAIFLHLARDGYLPTEGCVALAQADLLAYLAVATTASRVIVTR